MNDAIQQLLLVLCVFLATSSTITPCQAVISLADPWFHGSSVVYDDHANLTMSLPPSTQVGDLLVLAVSRTDGPMPSALGFGWDMAVTCFKNHNEQSRCYTIPGDCVASTIQHDPDGINRWYCDEFPKNRDGWDLNMIILTRKATAADVSINAPDFRLELRQISGRHAPAWAMMLAVSGVSGTVRGWQGVTCDKIWPTYFANVNGTKPGDLILMAMANDDRAWPRHFEPPSNTTPQLAFINGPDEAGFIYGGPVTDTLPTNLTTGGPGGHPCKDLAITLVLEADEDVVGVPTGQPTVAPTSSPPVASTSSPSISVNPTGTGSLTEQPSSKPTMDGEDLEGRVESDAPVTAPATSVPSEAPSPSPSEVPISTLVSTQQPTKALISAPMQPSDLPKAKFIRDASSSDAVKLARCQSDCDSDDHCAGDLVCFQRDENELVPGCEITGNHLSNNADYCVRKEDRDGRRRLRSRYLRERRIRR